MLWKIFLKPDLKAGEAYMDGSLTIESPYSIYDFLFLITKNMEWRPNNAFHLMGGDPYSRFKGWCSQINWHGKSKNNVAHHYDLSDDLYDLFLEEGRQYSSAYFFSDEETLEQAQQNKKNLIAKKLFLEEFHNVLDIGCGWGGLAKHINQYSGAKVTGVTLSEEQLKVATQNAVDNDKVKYKLQDYRDITKQFDRIVSVGMFEHVGRKQYETFFKKVYECLNEDGIALIHTIGRADGPGETDPWTKKYIFPGGYAPALSEITSAIEKSGLYITDIEVLRLHYAMTIEKWRERVDANKDKIIALYDERFLRMWEFYLASAECAFRNLGHVVFQFQLAKKQDNVPLHRKYLQD
ncbi:MAG: cyclopropane-fatty-acyl-phospholipid synthase [Emcibacteraceae bacterium]|nr:cyclopropane-fatty-acyl-phospholipid synthase [Emcibacteraceae bacterium]